MRILILIILIFSSCGLLPTSKENRNPQNIFDRDDREILAKSPAMGVGTLHLKPKADRPWGTAFFVSPCHIMTNYHVVKSLDVKMSDKDVRFFEIERDRRIKATPVLWGKPYENEAYNEEDWAILKLETCYQGAKIFTLKRVDPFAYGANYDFEMVGYPRDMGADKAARDPFCEIKEVAQGPIGGWKHNCASRDGSSGSPIFYSRDGVHYVAAINASQRGEFQEIIKGWSEWIGNGAVPVENFLLFISRYASEHPEARIQISFD